MSGRRFKRVPGMVVSVRVNPEDCINVLNVMERGGVNTTGMSFSQMVSLCLGGLLERMKNTGVIPEPDMYEYGDRMQRFMRDSERKQQLAQALPTGSKPDLGPSGSSFSSRGTEQQLNGKRADLFVVDDVDLSSQMREMQGLLAEAAEGVLTPEKLARLKELEKLVFGD